MIFHYLGYLAAHLRSHLLCPLGPVPALRENHRWGPELQLVSIEKPSRPVCGRFREGVFSRVTPPLRSGLVRLVAGLVLFTGIISTGVRAQKGEASDSSRKLVTQVQAEYPADLKRALIGGVVRLNVVVTARGTVDYVQVAGGNPILADAATKAVKQWKYSPSASSTNIRVNIRFDPTR